VTGRVGLRLRGPGEGRPLFSQVVGATRPFGGALGCVRNFPLRLVPASRSQQRTLRRAAVVNPAAALAGQRARRSPLSGGASGPRTVRPAGYGRCTRARPEPPAPLVAGARCGPRGTDRRAAARPTALGRAWHARRPASAPRRPRPARIPSYHDDQPGSCRRHAEDVEIIWRPAMGGRPASQRRARRWRHGANCRLRWRRAQRDRRKPANQWASGVSTNVHRLGGGVTSGLKYVFDPAKVCGQRTSVPVSARRSC
jgi:hypothetical protein